MFGYYTNKRLSENETKLLKNNPDDYTWYMVVLNNLFKDGRLFQVREDIKLPQKDGDNGVVIVFRGGYVNYFKTVEGDVDEEEMDLIVNVCSFLNDLFNRPIEAYIACPAGCHVMTKSIDSDKGELKLVFSHFCDKRGEEVVDELQNKLDNNEEFSISDSINHMLLPFESYNDKHVFKEKYKYYMDSVNSYFGD